MHQFELFSQPKKPAIGECEHESGFLSDAYVPGGFFCTKCSAITMRLMPAAKEQPETIGYVSADWAWKYVHGNQWTDDYLD